MLEPLPDSEIMLEWMHQCRTCKHWKGDRKASGNVWGECAEPAQDAPRTTQCGDCCLWEPWDEKLYATVVEQNRRDIEGR